MGRQVVQHHLDSLGLRVMLVHEIAHALGKVDARPVVGDLGVAPGAVHVHKQDVRGAVAHVLIVDPSGLPRLGPDGDTRVPD